MRERGDIGRKKHICEKQLCSTDKEYLRNTLVEQMPSAGAYAASGASTVRKIGEEVLKWQASQGCQRIPNPRSLDDHEKSLGKRFQDVLRRRYCAIGVFPSQQQLRADDCDFINSIPGVPPHGCSVNTGARGVKPCQQQLSADEIHFINGIPGVGVFH